MDSFAAPEIVAAAARVTVNRAASDLAAVNAGRPMHTHTCTHAHWHTVKLSISAFMSKLRERRHSKWNWG